MTFTKGLKPGFLTALLFLLPTPAKANEFELVSGLTQILAKGFNLEGAYKTEHMVFDYSHGYHLDVTNQARSKKEEEAKMKILVRNSTGGGVGYRLTPSIHLNAELKRHFFEISRPGFEMVKYHTTTAGLGLYYTWKPFQNYGFIIVPAFRYWPTVSNNLGSDGSYTYSDGLKIDYKETGIKGFTANIKLGWQF